jgi:hypothetical protein
MSTKMANSIYYKVIQALRQAEQHNSSIIDYRPQQNPPNSPWGEIRNNDMHLSLEEKLRARE